MLLSDGELSSPVSRRLNPNLYNSPVCKLFSCALCRREGQGGQNKSKLLLARREYSLLFGTYLFPILRFHGR